MATKAEVTGAIRDGIARVETTFGGLTDEQLATPVHNGGGWTARDILAHLAGRAPGYEMMFRMATGDAPRTGGLDIDAWNAARIAELDGKGRDELIAEMRRVHEALAARVEALGDDDLARTIAGFRGPVEFGEMLRASGGLHSVSHAAEVEVALGLPAPTA